MANLHYMRDTEIDETDKFLTVGELMSILSDVKPETKVFIRNLDEWGEKLVIKDGFGYSEASDGLIENIIKANIDQINGDYEYIIIQGCINNSGFVTLDREPYSEVIYHHTWMDKILHQMNPIRTLKQLKDKFMKVEHICLNCSSFKESICDKDKREHSSNDSCELWEYRE